MIRVVVSVLKMSMVLQVRWGESSLRNGFGLKFLHRFFNVPFLTLQRQSLLQQLEVNRRDILATQEELDVYMESEEANYQLFSDSLTSKRRAAAEQAAPPPSASISMSFFRVEEVLLICSSCRAAIQHCRPC